MAAPSAVLTHFSPWSWDVDADVIWSLPGLYVMHGWRQPSEAVDQTRAIPVPRHEWLEGLPESQRDRIRAFCEAILETGTGGELRYPVASGDEVRWLVLQAAVAERDRGGVRRVLGYTRNVTADRLLELAARTIEREGIQGSPESGATVQPGVSVLNRYPFQEALNSRVAERLQPTLLLFVEVERLRYLSNELGETASTALLAEVAVRLRDAAGPDALIGSFRAGEFAIAVDCTSPAHLRELVGRVLDAFSTRISAMDEELFLDATIRVAEGEPGTDAYSLIRDAAAATPIARSQESGRHRTHGEALRLVREGPADGESELRRALELDELVLHYQPILEVANHRLSRLEALVRWEHPSRGLLVASEFIPLAESSGLIVPLGQRVLELAARDGATWIAAMPGLRIAINVSVLQLEDPGFVDDTLARLQQAGLPPSSVDLQIAESGLIRKLDVVAPMLERLQSRSIGVVVDDFGSGYSALARLGELAISSLKIDRQFISGVATDLAARTVVRSVVAIARAHGHTVVAKGVEDAFTLAAVEELGCDQAQGFFLAEPVPAHEVPSLPFEVTAPLQSEVTAPQQFDAAPPRLRLVGDRAR